MSRTGVQRGLLAALAALNALLVWWFFRHVLTAIPNTGDEYSLLFQARIFSTLRWTAPAPPHAELFAPHYVETRAGRWFGIYPPLYPLLLALGQGLGGPEATAAALSSASLLLAHRLVLRGYRDAALAWTATLLLFVAPSFRFYSASYSSHVGALAAVLLCWNLLWDALESGGRSRWLAVGLTAGAAAGIRPFEAFWALGPAGLLALAVRLRRRRPGAWRGPLSAAAAAGAALALLLYANSRFSGAWDASVYLDVVNQGGKLAAGRNLAWGQAVRLWAMLADAAKWLFGYGGFRSGNLKDVTAADWNFSLPLLCAGALWCAGAAARGGPTRRADALFVAVAASVVAGHLFYDKDGGRFGERRFYEASAVFCLFAARLLRDLTRRAPPGWAAAAVLAVCAPSLAIYLPRTAVWVRDNNEARFELFLDARRLGLRGALIFVDDVPEFTPSFYVRNDPDLRGNVYAVGRRNDAAVARMFPRRPRYAFALDWRAGRYGLRPAPGRGARAFDTGGKS